MPKFVGANIYDIQVLTPMRKGELGVERLNVVLQHYLNPKNIDKKEIEYNSVIYREGDKIMQIKNNYQAKWVRKGYNGITVEEGEGVFNGDIGIIKKIDTIQNEIDVEFDENRTITYQYANLDELEHAYAITIHKSQGSEYPAVVIPLLTVPKMLMNRNLLYTAVTRAKQCVTIVGSAFMLQEMIYNSMEQERYSSLHERIMQLSD